MMDCGKWMTTALILISVALTASQLDDDRSLIETNVFVGPDIDIDLECVNSSDTTRRFWKKLDDILVFFDEFVINNDPGNRSANVRMVNVTFNGKDKYLCTVHRKPKLVKETPCEAPQKPLNGDYESQTEGDTYRTGDTIRYHCHRGYRMIGESNRTCTGTHNGWQPHEPYCEPEYIGRLLRRLEGIEDKVKTMQQRITNVENITSAINNKRSTNIESQISSVDIPSMESLNRPISKIREHIVTCSNDTKVIDPSTVFKCMHMQLGVRNGLGVFESQWVVEDFKSKVAAPGYYYSSPFYHTLPGYKLRLKGHIHSTGDILISPYLLPGEYDDQLEWPTDTQSEVTVITNDGAEVRQMYQNSYCPMTRPTSATRLACGARDYNWDNVLLNQKHILSDGSVVFKLYKNNG